MLEKNQKLLEKDPAYFKKTHPTIFNMLLLEKSFSLKDDDATRLCACVDWDSFDFGKTNYFVHIDQSDKDNTIITTTVGFIVEELIKAAYYLRLDQCRLDRIKNRLGVQIGVEAFLQSDSDSFTQLDNLYQIYVDRFLKTDDYYQPIDAITNPDVLRFLIRCAQTTYSKEMIAKFKSQLRAVENSNKSLNNSEN